MQLKALAITIAVLTTLFPGWPDFRISLRDGVRVSRNFHVVDPERLYRSAQPYGGETEDLIRTYKIRTIINLQGEKNGWAWYDKEAAAAKREHVKMINLSFARDSIPKKSDLRALLKAFDNAERPILIHCRSGSDRTGEAVAIYMMEYMNLPKQKALQALSWKYLHSEMFVPSNRYFIHLYEGKIWAKTKFDECSSSYQFADRRFCPARITH